MPPITRTFAEWRRTADNLPEGNEGNRLYRTIHKTTVTLALTDHQEKLIEMAGRQMTATPAPASTDRVTSLERRIEAVSSRLDDRITAIWDGESQRRQRLEQRIATIEERLERQEEAR